MYVCIYIYIYTSCQVPMFIHLAIPAVHMTYKWLKRDFRLVFALCRSPLFGSPFGGRRRYTQHRHVASTVTGKPAWPQE